MKHIWKVLAVCLLLAAMTACGTKAEEPAAPVQEEIAAPVEEPAPVEEREPVEEPAEPETPEEAAEPAEPEAQPEPETVEEPEEPAGPTVEDALAFVDQDVSALYAAIGEPLSSSYEASCAGDGDDGILEYDGFIVFTYREPDGSAETVVDAE